MISLGIFKEVVEVDPAVAGDDFHERLHERLERALAESGVDPDDVQPVDLEAAGGRDLIIGSFSDTYTKHLKAMEEQVCLDDEYEIPSHRAGFLGSFNRFVKQVVMKLKLKTDVQVSQQAKFNLETMTTTQLTRSHLDVLKAVVEEQMEMLKALEEKTEREAERFREEIVRLKERLDGR